MNQNNGFLSSATLKDKAKEALTGNYGKMILASFLTGVIIFAAQFVVSFTTTFLFDLFFIVKGISVEGLSMDQIQLLISQNAFVEMNLGASTAIDYVTTQILSIFTSVFNVGLSLYCLNLACGRTLHVSDLFYGFRYQFGKALKLTAVSVLVMQLYNLPLTLLTYLVNADAGWQPIIISLLLYVAGLVIYVPISLSISQMFLLLLDFPGYSAGELIKLSMHIMKGHKARLFYIELSFVPLLLLSYLTFCIGNLWLMPYMNVTYTFFFLNLMQAREKTIAPSVQKY